MRRRLRYADLLALGIVNNRPTLQNWIRDRGFPRGQLTGPNRGPGAKRKFNVGWIAVQAIPNLSR